MASFETVIGLNLAIDLLSVFFEAKNRSASPVFGGESHIEETPVLFGNPHLGEIFEPGGFKEKYFPGIRRVDV